MTNYLLIHGGSHAGWCWEKMIPFLKKDRRVGQVLALDLVGHGSRLKEKNQDQITIQDYVKDITDAIVDRDLREVVIAGHSMAGAFIPQAAALIPDRVKQLVFISGVIPPDRHSVEDAWNEIGFSPDFGGTTPQSYYCRIFCQDMDEATTRWFLSRIGPEPRCGLTEPVNRSPLPGSISKSYVLLTTDQVVPVKAQYKFAGNMGITRFDELAAGHNAMISHPKELAEVLLRYA